MISVSEDAFILGSSVVVNCTLPHCMGRYRDPRGYIGNHSGTDHSLGQFDRSIGADPETL